MNIFGAVTFGSLIKTFLPGLVWLCAFGIVEADVAQYRGYESYVLKILGNSSQASTLLIIAFPVSIFVGLLSNVVVFMGLNDWLVRTPFKTNNRELSTLHARLSQMLRDQSWTALGLNDAALKASFDQWTDPEIILVERIGPEKLAYVREQYWYHLEFQLNLLISFFAVFAALVASASINGIFDSAGGFGRFVALIVIYVLISLGLLFAARKNYERHVAKMASLLTAVLTQPKGEEAEGA
jgi:fucose 4-O-acetylase-like acetyltransferase